MDESSGSSVRRHTFPFGVAFAAFVCAAIFCQTSPETKAQQVFRTGAHLVSVDVSVTSGGKPVVGLGPKDFAVGDNNVPQTIVELARESLPLDVTLVVDLSGGGVLQTSVLAGVKRLAETLGAADRLRIVTFDGTVHADRGLQPRAEVTLPALGPGTHDAIDMKGGSVCYDAIVAALNTPAPPERRSFTILLSTGRDTGSRTPATEILNAARRFSGVVSVVLSTIDRSPRERLPDGAVPRPVPVDPHAIPGQFFASLTSLTGGTVDSVSPIQVLRNDSMGSKVRATIGTDGVSERLLRSLEEFRNSYVLRYYLEGVPLAGWHDVQVRVVKKGGNYVVRARKGYAG